MLYLLLILYVTIHTVGYILYIPYDLGILYILFRLYRFVPYHTCNIIGCRISLKVQNLCNTVGILYSRTLLSQAVFSHSLSISALFGMLGGAVEQCIHNVSARRIPLEGFGLLSDDRNVKKQVFHILAQAF